MAGGETIHHDGLRHVHIDGCLDPDALELVLNIIHGRTSLVARELDLEYMAKVAVVVDDLDVYDTVSFCVDHWIRHLPTSSCGMRNEGNNIAKDMERNMILLLLVSVVFKHRDLLGVAAWNIIFSSKGSIPTQGLPLNQGYISK